MKNTPIKIIILLSFIVLIALLFGCDVPQKTPDKPITEITIIHDTITYIDAVQYEIKGDSLIRIEYRNIPCPVCTTVINNIKKQKKSGNTDNSVNIELRNSYNELNKLKNSIQVRDSAKIDSLTAIIGKRSVGTQTNNGLAWYILILIGMGIGTISTELIRVLITKKP